MKKYEIAYHNYTEAILILTNLVISLCILLNFE